MVVVPVIAQVAANHVACLWKFANTVQCNVASFPGSSIDGCGREANFVTMAKLKRRLPSDVFRPKKASEAISGHQIF